MIIANLSVSSQFQVQPQFTHYTVDDGLPSNDIICQLQDKRGNMWFGTYDGLCKFDGYSFKLYTGNPDKSFTLYNLRIDQMREDQYGNIWLQTYDGRIYRFDPSIEKFTPMPQLQNGYKNYKGNLNRFAVLNDGSVWLYNSNNAGRECFRVINEKVQKDIRVIRFDESKKQITSGKINKIYLDKSRNTWVLSSKGISVFKQGGSVAQSYFDKNNQGAFFSICESFSNTYLGGDHGRLLLFDQKKKTFTNIDTPFRSNIIDIQQVSKNELFILTDSSGFSLFDQKTRRLTIFNRATGCGLTVDNFFACFKDKRNNIWLDADNFNVVYFETGKRKVNTFTVFTDRLSTYSNRLHFLAVEDHFGNTWIQPRSGGLSLYNRKLNKLEPFYNESGSKERKFSNLVRTAMSDHQGNLWVCPYSYGIEKISFRKTPFEFTKPFSEINYSEQNQIRSLCQDQDNWLWVGTKNGYLYVYDEKHNIIGRISANGAVNKGVPFNAFVYNIISDHNGVIWLATKGKGLIKVVKEQKGKSATFSLTNYRYNSDDIYSLSSDDVYSVYEDNQHRIWIGTFGGGINLLTQDLKGKVSFINYRNKLRSYPFDECNQVRCISGDKQNHIFVGSTRGLVAFTADLNNPERIRFYHYRHDLSDENSIGGDDVMGMLVSGNGDLYLGTNKNGLNVLRGGFDPAKKVGFQHYSKINNNDLGTVFTVQEDAKGNVWMSTQNKLVKLNPKSDRFDVYSPIANTPYSYMEAAFCKTRQGDFIYGTTEGFVRFNPMKARKSTYVPQIRFTQLLILNQIMEVDVKGSPLTKIIDEMHTLELNHNQNTITINFTALDLSEPKSIQYAYKMEGVDKDWNYVGNRREANYANLPKGKYVFRVKSTNSDGEWVNNERSIVIEKLPSFWESAWGLVFYFILFLIISLLVSYILFTYYRLKNEVEVEHRISNMKLRFFTDISHELRTPLTLIASPLENILRNEKLSDIVKDQLIVMQRNTDRMLRLINQILDFRKIQSSKMKLLVENIQVGQYLEEISAGFRKLAEDRKIELNIIDETDHAHLWVDKDKFEKIFYNLLSNAFKFSLPGNPIEVHVVENEEAVTISVSDTGIGIGKDMIKTIFNRFESLVTDGSGFQASTGIGLALTKELVELHKGKIEVESETGKGSSFKVSFLKGKAHFTNTEEYIIQDMETGAVNIDSNTEIEQEPAVGSKEQPEEPLSLSERPTILVVEDNVELRDFLTSVLRYRYVVFEAENGKKALEILPDITPDLIISDIMMPEMNGLELSKAIKEDISFSHIPLVLLTAKDDIDSKLEAMEYGVDDYITKPFSSAYLEARIENLLKLRKQLQDFYRSSLTSGVISLAKPQVTSQDDLFIKRIMAYIEENMDDSDLSIDGIASHMGLGRSTMFKKLKSLTGLAPVDFIKEIRIQRAAQYIETGEFNVSEVAYKVGIIYPRYFSKCFKDKYGMTPSEYKEKCQQNKS